MMKNMIGRARTVTPTSVEQQRFKGWLMYMDLYDFSNRWTRADSVGFGLFAVVCLSSVVGVYL